jgi:hypothetical protein
VAREYGKLKKSRWRDSHWAKLTADAQWLYTYLLSQPSTDTAGVFPIQVSKWAKGAADMTVERVKAAAKILADNQFIIVDWDTEEGLLRTYIADDEAGGLIFIGALNRAVQAQSSILRRRLLEEILRLERTFTDREQARIDELADALDDPAESAASPSPSPTTATQAFERTSKTVRRPFEDSSKTVEAIEADYRADYAGWISEGDDQ